MNEISELEPNFNLNLYVEVTGFFLKFIFNFESMDRARTIQPEIKKLDNQGIDPNDISLNYLL